MSTAKPVTRRRVFYVPGYDPFPPRRYRELYRKEAAAQAAISGYDIALATKPGQGAHSWSIKAQIDGQDVHTDMTVLYWADLVRDSMARSIPATYLQLLRTAWIYIATGALWRLMRLRKGPVIAALYPVVFLLVQAALAIVIGLAAAALIAKFVAGALGTVLSFGAGLGLAWLVLETFRRQDKRFFAYYLMHDYAHSAQHQGAYPDDLSARLAAFRESIAQALTENVDEVLIVGHSSGAHLAVTLLADLIRQGNVLASGPSLSFLSLGHVVPMVSFLPRAYRLRADLAVLSKQDTLAWVDVTAPGDGCAFALCDPVAVTGVAGPDQRWPLVLSAAFTKSLSPARWKALRWRFFRLHFQYLCAFDRPRGYDYFQITAGPQKLGARYAGRNPSRSRITRAVSKYTATHP